MPPFPMLIRVLAALVALGLSWLVPALAEAQPIKNIEVVDNTKTTDETVILIADISKGDNFNPRMVNRIRSDLVSSGLFKSVNITYSPVPGGVKLIISARDKHSWIVAPTYYNQPTNKGGGFGFGENNLFGENKKLLLYGQVATGDTFFIGAYIDPSIRGTRFKWQLDLYLKRERSIEYAPPNEFFDTPREVRHAKLNYFNGGLTGGIHLFRGASAEVRLRGAWVSYDDIALANGATMSDVTDNPTMSQVPAPGGEGYDISSELTLEYDRRANWYGITHGNRYRILFGRSVQGVSDFDYWHTSAEFLRARRYFQSHNLILKTSLSYGDTLPFQQELTAGGTGLRGYKNDQFRGNLAAKANVEYSLQALSVKGVSLRLLGFLDSGYTAFIDTDRASQFRNYLPGHDQLGAAPFKNTVGIGTRLYVRQIVLPLLGLDLGYGIERKAFEIYLAIGLTDV